MEKRKIMKKTILFLLTLLLVSGLLIGCSPEAETTVDEPEEEKTIIMISKVYQNPWYQVAYDGAIAAGEEYGFKVVTQGPNSSSDIQQQVELINAAVNQKPYALLLAAISPDSIADALAKAEENGVHVIAFDGALPGFDNVLATIATDNEAAGALAADKLFEDEGFVEAVMKGTTAEPVVIGALAEDGTSSTLIQRMAGFVDQMVKNLETLEGFEGAVEVTGQTQWLKPSDNDPKVKIITSVPPTAGAADLQAIANAMFLEDNLLAIYACNNGTVDGVLSATNDGADLNPDNGKYKDIYVVGFDAGTNLKEAVRSGAFFGAITQDPYYIGYNAVKAVYDLSQGKSVSDDYPSARWYDSENMDDPDIARLLYD